MKILICFCSSGILMLCGCLGQNVIHRKSVNDLFAEASVNAMERSGVVQPSDAYALPAGESEFARMVGPSELSKPSPPPRLLPGVVINETFDQTDVREAIDVLATTANRTVIVDDAVGGVTSVQMRGVPFDDALKKVLAPLGLHFAIEGDTYFIAPADPRSPLFSKIARRYQYAPVHHNVKGLMNLLPARHREFITNSDERNLILIDAPPEIGHEILERLGEMDTPVPQIELEAIVCVTSPDSGFRFGLDWNHVVGVNGIDSLKAGMTGLSFSGSTSQAGAKNAFSDFAVTSAFVRLLAQEGYITIRAAPRVTTKDGEKANISIHRETFFSLQNNVPNAFFVPNIQKVEAGITLEITPRVHGDMISVNIAKAEVSEDIRSSDVRPELTSNPYPIINRINRIPYLSRIPVAGKLFQTIEKQEQDAEVAIFISPKRVVDNLSCVETEYIDGH
jgi:type IV pilus assembly protein PilQ